MSSSHVPKFTHSLNSLVPKVRHIRQCTTSSEKLDTMAMFSKVQLMFLHPLIALVCKVRLFIMTFLRYGTLHSKNILTSMAGIAIRVTSISILVVLQTSSLLVWLLAPLVL